MTELLIVGSMRPEVQAASRMAVEQGAKLRHAPDIHQAMTILCAGKSADLILIDVKADIDAMVGALKRQHIVVSIVAYGIDTEPRAAVSAIKAGAVEFLPLPPDQDLIASILQGIAETDRELIFADPIMGDVLELARKIAPSEASVLITGESGTGKEMLARYLHQHSRRSGGKMISLNCAAIPDTLLESELFGHEKGAFTGATSKRIGKFEEASGGTLLLDEISEMDFRLQAKLLRAIQEREIDRVGGQKPVKIDIRLLATSNRDLQAEVQAGRFREDLFFRLNVVQLEIPPLRDRIGDIIPLSRFFVERYAIANHLPTRALSSDAADKLRNHWWRGNVRELENCLHRAVLLAQGEVIGPEAIHLQNDGLPAGLNSTMSSSPAMASALVGQSMAEVERKLILNTLEHTIGNRTQAATILGISIRTLRNKLRQYAEEGQRIMPVGPHPYAHRG